MEISCTDQLHSLGQDQSTVAQRAETTVAKRSQGVACKLVSVLDLHAMPGQHNQLSPTLLGQECMLLKVQPATSISGKMTGVFYMLLW